MVAGPARRLEKEVVLEATPEQVWEAIATARGLAPVGGVIDYLSPTRMGVAFLGVRTPGGLYRFHGRSGLGAPVAVGHHLFSGRFPSRSQGEADRNEAGRAWASWLDRLFPGPA